jgi:hypothetical protein
MYVCIYVYMWCVVCMYVCMYIYMWCVVCVCVCVSCLKAAAVSMALAHSLHTGAVLRLPSAVGHPLLHEVSFYLHRDASDAF